MGESWSYLLTDLERGFYNLRARVTDDRGDAVYSDWIALTVHSSLPPLIGIPSPIENALLTSNSFPVEVDAWDTDGSIAEVALYRNDSLVGTSATVPVVFPQNGLTHGAHRFSVRALDDSGEVSWLERTIILARGEVALPWMNFDIGDVAAAGSASISGMEFTISGSGNDIWNNQSEFHFTGQPVYGDAEIVVQMKTQINTNNWAKAGLMVCQNLTPGAIGANLCVTPSSGITFQYRTAQDGSMNNTRKTGLATPVWLKLVKTGSLVSGYSSSDGTTWSLVGSRGLDIPDPVYMGLCITSHHDGVVSTATGSFAVPGGIALADTAPRQSYSEFLAASFSPEELANPMASGTTADFDQDGLMTIEEYLHGQHPKVPSHGHGLRISLEPSSAGSHPRVAFVRDLNHPDINWLLVARPNLTDAPTPLTGDAVQLAPLGNGRFKVVGRHPATWDSAPVFFQIVMSIP